jgi:2,4-dienoyl-CoA reductase-like NADH-dependent reductase (Old Yellow Enzyme family)
VITEGVHISPQARGWVDVPGIWTQEQVEHWKVWLPCIWISVSVCDTRQPITKSVRDNGSVFFVQLWHMGRQSHSSFHNGALPVSASEIPMSGFQAGTADYKKAEPEVPHALTVEEIKQVVAVCHSC